MMIIPIPCSPCSSLLILQFIFLVFVEGSWTCEFKPRVLAQSLARESMPRIAACPACPSFLAAEHHEPCSPPSCISS